MPKQSPSSRFTSVYESLPIDAQQEMVEKHLIPLLNLVDKFRSKKVLTRAANLNRRHAGIPVLDLKSKRIEVNALLEEVHKDAKRSFVKDRSRKKELLDETIDSLTDWLNDIWSVVYEHNVEFIHAHKCLLFVAGTLDHLGSGRSSCRCTFANMFINVTLKRKNGKRVKTFDISGAHKIEEILHFIWRDLFLSMLAVGNKRQIKNIPDMLEDIEDMLGWSALERILYGGKSCTHDYEDSSDCEDTEGDYDIETEGDECDPDFYDEDMGSSAEHARHWSWRISDRMPDLRRYIVDAMTAIFKLSPSLQLLIALCAMSPNPDTTEEQLLHQLDLIAVSSSDTFAAALDIYAYLAYPTPIMNLLKTHRHLIRPRDTVSLQNATKIICRDPAYAAQGLAIVERELLDTTRALRSALLVSFSQLDLPANKGELLQILKLRQGGAGRQDRIESWIDSISTPGTAAPNPMAFAAMMMGLPLVPGMDPAEDADPLGYLDLDPSDPDLEDLREEFRPRLKQRFEGWNDVAVALKAGPVVQQKVFKDIVEMMPFLRANDIVDEMVGRLADKPSKHYVCDALDAFLHFVKSQRKKASNMQKFQRRKDNLKHLGAPSSTSDTNASTTLRTSTTPSASTSTAGAAGPSTPNTAPQPAVPNTAPPAAGTPAIFHLNIPYIGPSSVFNGLDDVD